MKLKTRVFELCNGRYQSLSELVQAMGISYDLLYRVRRGDHIVNGRFIIGATKASSGYKLAEKSQTEEEVVCVPI